MFQRSFSEIFPPRTELTPCWNACQGASTPPPKPRNAPNNGANRSTAGIERRDVASLRSADHGTHRCTKVDIMMALAT